jgi:hypothetical protein
MRWGRLTIGVGLGFLAVALLATVALSAGVRPAGSEPAQLLRLPDLPLGFVNLELREDRGDAPTCERLTEPEDTPPRMLRFVHRFHPRGCMAGYGFSFVEPLDEGHGPAFVGSAVLDTRSRAEADAAWAVAPEILARLVGDKHLEPVEPAARIGSATRAFHTRIEFVDGPIRVSYLVWRSGKTLATVVAFGGRFSAVDQTLAEYARRQQAHIAHPSPYTEAELFDGEVGLEEPTIDLPVYWLGRSFRPGGDLPENRLFDSYFAGKARPEHFEDGFDEGPLAPLGIRYENIRLDTWGPDDWPAYSHSKTGRAITTWKCTQSRKLAVPGGSATIYGGYNQDFAHCPKRPPRAYTAWVRYGEDTVVVDAPFSAEAIEIVNPYGSWAGMEAIVKGLRPR